MLVLRRARTPSEQIRPMMLWQLSERIRLREALKRLYRAEIVDADRIPASGPTILVANHESLLDPWFLCLATPRRVRFMAKAELWRYPVVRWAMEAYGTFPVERGRGDTLAMGRGGELLDQGEILGMFPRGTSKPAGNRIWHRGAVRLALAHDAVLLPVRLENTRQLLPRRRVRVVVGSPIELDRKRAVSAEARDATARAEAAVEALR